MTDQIYIPFIPEIRKRMSSSEYEVFALCYALDERGKTIYFSNGYLGELLGKSKRTIAGILEKLEKAGFIKRILSETGRIIEIVKEKIKSICKNLQGVCKKVQKDPVKKSASNNIDSDNKIHEKESLDFVKEFFEKISEKYDIDTDLISETFINKHLSGDTYKKNIGNWKGRARNFFKYWLKNLESRGEEPKKLAKWEIAYKKNKDATKVRLNNKIYIVKNRQVVLDSGDYPLAKLIRKWYDSGKSFDFAVSRS
jgi:DNA-binding MarR family transcriptional regulator